MIDPLACSLHVEACAYKSPQLNSLHADGPAESGALLAAPLRLQKPSSPFRSSSPIPFVLPLAPWSPPEPTPVATSLLERSDEGRQARFHRILHSKPWFKQTVIAV